MLQYTRLILLYILVLSFISVSFLCSQPKNITILHTNDLHSAFLPREAVWVRTNPQPLVGGFLELSYIVDSIRNVKTGVILLDGGDVMTGNPISEIEYKSAFGGAVFEMMNLIGYDAWTLGNHDLDISQENLVKLTQIAKFATVCANIVDSLGNFHLNNKEYLILNKNGLRVGIVGIMSKNLFELTNTTKLIGIRVLPPAETLQKVIDKIDNETDLIIALTHQGFVEDSILATRVNNLDVIIGSHSHTRLVQPKVVNNIIICQAGSYCENIGILELTVENDRVTSHSGKLHTLWVRGNYTETPLSALVNEFKSRIDKEYGEIIGRAEVDLNRSRSGESNIGQFIAEAIREETGADIGIVNQSGIRKDILNGNIKKIDIFEVAPFRNYLCTFQLTGKEVRKFVKRYVQSLMRGRTSIEFTGLNCIWRRVQEDCEIVSIKINDLEIEDDKIYTCGTIDYLINQSERYLQITLTDVSYSSTLLYDALVAKVKQQKSIQGKLKTQFKEIQYE